MKEIKKKIFKPIPQLDAEIRTITEIPKPLNKKYFIIEIGTYESLGEQGEILTLVYETLPTEQEIIEYIQDELKETFINLQKNICLTAREEKYLVILKKIFKR